MFRFRLKSGENALTKSWNTYIFSLAKDMRWVTSEAASAVDISPGLFFLFFDKRKMCVTDGTREGDVRVLESIQN